MLALIISNVQNCTLFIALYTQQKKNNRQDCSKIQFSLLYFEYIIMQAPDHGIIEKYVTSQQYVKTADFSRRRNILYDNYLEIFQKIFTSYREFYEETQQLFRNKTHQKIIYVQQLKSFLRKFAEILKNTSSYQVDCITELRINRQDNVDILTQDLLPKINGYAKDQRQFKVKIDSLQGKKNILLDQYKVLKNKSNSVDPSDWYNYREMKTITKQIIEKIKDIEFIQTSLEKNKNQIYHNSEQFQSNLIFYRKRLLQNKYNILNRMNDQSKHLRSCLTQMLSLLIQCVNTKFSFFDSLVKNPRNDTMTTSQGKRKKGEDVDTLISNLINAIQEYNHLVDELMLLIKGLDNALKAIQIKIKNILELKKSLMQNMNALFSIDQTPSKQVTQTLDLYEYYTTKMVGISDKLYQCYNKLQGLKQNVKKHADVTLSLIRTKGNTQQKCYQIDLVYQQISHDFITAIVREMYTAFKQSLSELKTYFNQKYYKKKKNKVQDSMEISHVDQTIIAQKKKPCKDQLWLWRDWRDKTNFFITNSGIDLKEISQYVASIKFEAQSKQINQYKCSFNGKKEQRGILKVCQKALQFTTVIGTSNLHLCIPYSDITNVDSKIKTLTFKASDRYLSVQTQKGELLFSKLPDLQATVTLIKQNLQKAQKQSGGKIVKKQAVQLLPEQIEYLQKNRVKINEQRPSCENLIKIKSIFVENITVDQVYEYIYSDKQFTLRGTPQINFFSYTHKKNKNFNYKTSPYNSQGPEFYSGNPGIKFTTCTPYSTRVSEFDHPLPKIPFIPMPQSCHCKQKCSIFWLSNEGFDYYVISESSGAPYADTFVVKILHRVHKEGTGVRVQMLGGLFFVKDVAMKGMLKSKGENQMVQGGQFTMNQIQKTLKIVSGSVEGKIQSEAKQQQTKTGTNSGSTNEVSKLKNQNKLLIIALVLVFLINIILRFFIS